MDPIHHSHAVNQLNDTQKRIHQILASATGPLSAYDILDQMKGKDAVTPPTIYRSLDKLIEKGLVHRLESLNAYVTCRHTHEQGMAAFAICDGCAAVKEFADPQIDESLIRWSNLHDFYPKTITVEMHGLCKTCNQEKSL